MHQKVEEMVSENIQSPQAVVESKARHQKGTISTGLAVKPTAHSGIYKKLGNPARVLDKRVSFDDVGIVILKRIFKRIGIGQEDQESHDQAEKFISSHNYLASPRFFCKLINPAFRTFDFLEAKIRLNSTSAFSAGP